jgi:hypothetical protein
MADEPLAQVPSKVSTAIDTKANSSHRLPLKKFSKLLPSLLSVMAVVISLLAYMDQHSANTAAQRSAESVYAANASFWLVYYPPPLSKREKEQLKRANRAIRELVEALEGMASTVDVSIENRNNTPLLGLELFRLVPLQP